MAGRVGTGSTNLVSASPFLGGLNTELSGVVDSTDFTRDELNMIIRPDGTRSRRFGIDYEELFKLSKDPVEVGNTRLAFNCILWDDTNHPEDAVTNKEVSTYIVCQVGGKIIFYKQIDGEPFSANEVDDFQIDLKDYRLDETDDVSYQTERCSFEVAYGTLFITSKAIQTIMLRSPSPDKERPVIADQKPYCTIACESYDGPHQRVGRLTVGSSIYNSFYRFFINGVEIGLLEQEPDHPWPTSLVLAEFFNSLPEEVRKGITAVPYETTVREYPSYGSMSWTPYDEITFKGSSIQDRGTKISFQRVGHYYRSGKARAMDETRSAVLRGGQEYKANSKGFELYIRDTSVGAEDYLNIDTAPEKCSYAHLYNLLNQGWTINLLADYYKASSSEAAPSSKSFPANNLAQQYLKDSTTTKFKPEALLNTTFGNTPAARGHVLLNFFNQDRVAETDLVKAMEDLVEAIVDAGVSVTLDDIRDKLLPEGPAPVESEEEMAYRQVPVIRPRKNFVADVLHYAGRMFYLVGDTLLYSQVISEDLDRVGDCYTEADPTSEILSDIVESDGGTISLPDIGEGIRLQLIGPYLVVFGTKGTRYIAGTDNNIFTATAYSSGVLPVMTTQAPDSFVETEMGIFYWGKTNIVALGLENGAVSPQDLTTSRIQSFYGKITNAQHKYCKGVYSAATKKIYWFYPSDPENNPRKLDKILVLDLLHMAFLPQEISAGKTSEEEDAVKETPEIVSGLAVKTPFKNVKEYPITATTETNYFVKGIAKSTVGTLDMTKEYDYTKPENGLLFIPDESTKGTRAIRISTRFNLSRIKTFNDILQLYLDVNKGPIQYGEGSRVFSLEYIPDDRKLFWNYRHTSPGVWEGLYSTGYTLEPNKTYDIDIIISNQVISNQDSTNTSVFLRIAEEGGAYQRFETEYTSKGFEDIFTDSVVLCLGGNCAGYSSFGNDMMQGTIDLSKTTLEKWIGGEGYKNIFSLRDAESSEIVDDNGVKILADDPIESEEFTYESSILLCLDVANAKVTFGDFRSNLLRDWVAGDWEGNGYLFDSYLISHPMTCTGINQYGQRISTPVTQKSLPNVITGFRRTETGATTEGEYLYPSACQGSVLWNWATSGQFGKWDAPQEFYRPNKRTIFTDGYIFNRTNIRGLGRAYQLKLESVEDKQFILESISFNVQNDGRI